MINFMLLVGIRTLSIQEAAEFLLEDQLRGSPLDYKRRWNQEDQLQKAIKSGHLPATDIFPGREDIPFRDHWRITPADLEAWYLAQTHQKSQDAAPQPHPTDASEISPPTSTPEISPPPLFHSRERKDDWTLVICESAEEFQNKFHRPPKESELWLRLKTQPPESYGIKTAKDTITMGDETLTRSSFRKRWRRYNKTEKSES